MKYAIFLAATLLILVVCGFHFIHSIYHHQKYLYDVYRFLLFYALPFAGIVAAFRLAWTYSDRSLAWAVNSAAVVTAILLFEAIKVVQSGSGASRHEVAREDYDAAARSYPRAAVAIPILSYADRLQAADRGSDTPFPLGGLARARTLLCAEGRPLVAYTSDRHGFNNPDGLWSDPPLDLALIGDSFIHGQCNPEGSTIADVVRKTLPKTIGLAFSGNGPLIELATLAEFGAGLRPRHVVWCFYEGNDFDDLEVERGFAVLMRYLDRGWSAGLASRQHEVDGIVQAKLESDVVGKLERRSPGIGVARNLSGALAELASKQALRRVIGLQTLGAELGLAWGRGGGDQRLLEQVLRRAQVEAASWGAKLHFCYLPSSSRFRGRIRIAAPYDSYRSATLATAARLGLPIVDITDAFVRSGEGLRLFLPTGMHYSDQGARIAGEAISRHVSGQLR